MTEPENWVDNYGDALFAFALSRVRDRALAEELVQETFLAALGARKSFKGQSTERTWLTGILKHKIVDHFREVGREEPLSDIDGVTEAVDAFFDERGRWKVGPSKWNFNPVKILEQKEFWKVFQKCLDQLSHGLARVFTLREINGLTTEEVCKVLGISSTNKWVRMHRARMLIRRCLEVGWFDQQDEGHDAQL